MYSASDFEKLWFLYKTGVEQSSFRICCNQIQKIFIYLLMEINILF